MVTTRGCRQSRCENNRRFVKIHVRHALKLTRGFAQTLPQLHTCAARRVREKFCSAVIPLLSAR